MTSRPRRRIERRGSGEPEPTAPCLAISTPVFWSSFCAAHFCERLAEAQERDAAARQDTLFDSRTGRMHRVRRRQIPCAPPSPQLQSRHRRGDHHAAAGELGKTFLQLLCGRGSEVVSSICALIWDRDAGLVISDFLPAPLTIVVAFSLSIVIFLALPRPWQGYDVLELDAEIPADRLAAGQDGDVLAAWPCGDRRSPRSLLHGARPQAAAQLVDHERRRASPSTSSATIERSLAGSYYGTSGGSSSFQRRSFFSLDEDVGVHFHLNAHLVGVGDEAGEI